GGDGRSVDTARRGRRRVLAHHVAVSTYSLPLYLHRKGPQREVAFALRLMSDDVAALSTRLVACARRNLGGTFKGCGLALNLDLFTSLRQIRRGEHVDIRHWYRSARRWRRSQTHVRGSHALTAAPLVEETHVLSEDCHAHTPKAPDEANRISTLVLVN